MTTCRAYFRPSAALLEEHPAYSGMRFCFVLVCKALTTENGSFYRLTIDVRNKLDGTWLEIASVDDDNIPLDSSIVDFAVVQTLAAVNRALGFDEHAGVEFCGFTEEESFVFDVVSRELAEASLAARQRARS